MHELVIDTQINKAQKYEQLVPQIRAVIEIENDWIANLANIAAMLKQCFNFFWVGFYRRVGDELVLAPFQGPLACTRIAMSRGVCGHAASEQKTVIVPNVHEFPGHIACSSLSNSEIVVPLVQNQTTVLILDVDSTDFSDFDDTDALYLEQVMALISDKHPNVFNQK
ncbi:MAG: GAF domain-containing protein [Chitinophagales bacterium]